MFVKDSTLLNISCLKILRTASSPRSLEKLWISESFLVRPEVQKKFSVAAKQLEKTTTVMNIRIKIRRAPR